MRGLRRAIRPEYLLPVACVAAAALLIVSELGTTFELTPTGRGALQALEASDRHGYSLLVLGVFAIVATGVAVGVGSKPAALAVAAAGAIVLLIFLLVDLPDVNQVGPIEDPVLVIPDARAEPQTGFWLEMIGAVGLALAGGGLATLRPEQLRAPRNALGSLLAGGRRPAPPGRHAEDPYQRGEDSPSTATPPEVRPLPPPSERATREPPSRRRSGRR